MAIERHALRPSPIRIRNDGMRIVSTNYWETEQCHAGLFFLSTNAGCVRLLVPPAKSHDIPNMVLNVHEVVLTRGTFEGVENTVEVMFEDYSDSPYCIHVDPKQVDRRWVRSNEGKRWRFAIYTETGRVAAFSRCWLRSAPELPFAQPYERES